MTTKTTLTTHSKTTKNRHELTRITYYNSTTLNYNIFEVNK